MTSDSSDPAQSAPGEPPARTMADKLDFLFRTVRLKDGHEWTYREVAAAIEEAGGPKISATYIWSLRTGTRDNPTRQHIQALSAFFGVPPSYFFDEETTRRVEAELDLMSTLRDLNVRRIALRSSGLSEGGLHAINEMIEHVRRIEGLPVDDDPAIDTGGPNTERPVDG